MQLYEKYRPTKWTEVIGQKKALAKLDALRKRGLSGRSFWITGPTGTGKTTIARLIAQEVADDIRDYDCPEDLKAAHLEEITRDYEFVGMLGRGNCVIVNEAHGLNKHQIRKLLGLTEKAPEWFTWIFTTTNAGDTLFEEQMDSHPFSSRCIDIALARRGLAEPFAARARMIAQAEGLDGQPIEAYVKLAQKHKNNLRAMIQDIDGGCME